MFRSKVNNVLFFIIGITGFDANAKGSLMQAFDQAEMDNLHFFNFQPKEQDLKNAIRLVK